MSVNPNERPALSLSLVCLCIPFHLPLSLWLFDCCEISVYSAPVTAAVIVILSRSTNPTSRATSKNSSRPRLLLLLRRRCFVAPQQRQQHQRRRPPSSSPPSLLRSSVYLSYSHRPRSNAASCHRPCNRVAVAAQAADGRVQQAHRVAGGRCRSPVAPHRAVIEPRHATTTTAAARLVCRRRQQQQQLLLQQRQPRRQAPARRRRGQWRRQCNLLGSACAGPGASRSERHGRVVGRRRLVRAVRRPGGGGGGVRGLRVPAPRPERAPGAGRPRRPARLRRRRRDLGAVLYARLS